MFKFSNVLPGSYKITASKAGWCWKVDSTTIKVEASDAQAAPLVQAGYELQVWTGQADLGFRCHWAHVYPALILQNVKRHVYELTCCGVTLSA